MGLTHGELISLGSVLLVLIFDLISLWRVTNNSTKDDTEQLTKLSMQISEIQRGVDEIKAEIKDMKSDIQKDHDRIIILQRDVKTLWNKIDDRGVTDEN